MTVRHSFQQLIHEALPTRNQNFHWNKIAVIEQYGKGKQSGIHGRHKFVNTLTLMVNGGSILSGLRQDISINVRRSVSTYSNTRYRDGFPSLWKCSTLNNLQPRRNTKWIGNQCRLKLRPNWTENMHVILSTRRRKCSRIPPHQLITESKHTAASWIPSTKCQVSCNQAQLRNEPKTLEKSPYIAYKTLTSRIEPNDRGVDVRLSNKYRTK